MIYLKGSGDRLSKLDSGVEELPRDLLEFRRATWRAPSLLLLKSGGTDNCFTSLTPPARLNGDSASSMMRLAFPEIFCVCVELYKNKLYITIRRTNESRRQELLYYFLSRVEDLVNAKRGFSPTSPHSTRTGYNEKEIHRGEIREQKLKRYGSHNKWMTRHVKPAIFLSLLLQTKTTP